MKKFYFLLLAITATSFASAQGIHQLWGTTPYGGSDNQGVIFSTKFDGTGFRSVSGPTMSAPGSFPHRSYPLLFNDKLYSTVSYGGKKDYGIIMEFDPATSKYSKVADLSDIGARYPVGNLTVYNNKIYGVTYLGGVNDIGSIFEFNPANKGIYKRHDFETPNGRMPLAGLSLYAGKLYGVTSQGGSDLGGVIFEFDPSNFTYTKKYDFKKQSGIISYAALVEYNNKLYGSTHDGGIIDGGVLFSFDPANNAYTVLRHFTASSGIHPAATLTRVNNKLYGTTTGLAANGAGCVFEFDPVTVTFDKKVDLPADIYEVYGSLTLYNNKLYGLSGVGGINGNGTLFYYDMALETVTKKVNFYEGIGINPYSSLALYQNDMYAFALQGGNNQRGVFFKYDPAVNSIDIKAHLNQSNGASLRGTPTYMNGKFYGLSANGGTNNLGVLYQYDPKTNQYSVEKQLTKADGIPLNEEGLIAVNNKLYGVMDLGGNADKGVIFEYDPQTNLYQKLHDFASATGAFPYARLTFLNNKLYGTTTKGGIDDAGVIFEYDLGTQEYKVKVHLNANKGSFPISSLTEYQGNLYGTTRSGGANGFGTLFKYLPAANGFIKMHDFTGGTSGKSPEGALTAVNNKLYGLTRLGGINDKGVIYEIDPMNYTYDELYHFKVEEGATSSTTMTWYDDKLVGLVENGGPNDFGAIFTFDPVTKVYKRKTDFDGINAGYARQARLVPVPAPVAKGSPGSCLNTDVFQIAPKFVNKWVPFTDQYGNAVAEVNANGTAIYNVTLRYFVNDGPVRKDGNGRPYLDRNFHVVSNLTFVNPVSVRLYIRKEEFEALKNTPGSGVTTIDDLALFNSIEGFCNDAVTDNTQKIPCTVTPWGEDYVLSADVENLFAFYIASKNFEALPVHILSFNGVKEVNRNKLIWNAECTNDVDFVIERSDNGITFKQIGTVLAFKDDCKKPFIFYDEHPGAKNFYRLKMVEANANPVYSQIIQLNRDGSFETQVKVLPNPVQGATAFIQVNSSTNKDINLRVIDVAGRLLLQKSSTVQAGVNSITLPVQNLAPGIYQLIYTDGNSQQTLRFVKQ